MQQKKALLVREGVRFSGSKVSASSVVQAEELSALARDGVIVIVD